MPAVTRLDDHLHCIDLQFQDQPGVIASYLIEDGGERALIETGPTSTLEPLLAALREIDVDPNSIDKLLVTHIHLDHSGGAGAFMERFPRARLFAHDIGVPHLIDPEKLVSSATRIYGAMMGPLWGEVRPVPAARVSALTDNDVVTVGRRALQVLYTPGHASHHVAFHDAERNVTFTGDVAAVRLQGDDYVRPPTPPPDLDLEAWSRSIQRLRRLRSSAILLTHFGAFTDIDRHLDDAERRLYAWADVVEQAQTSGQDRTAMVDALRLYADNEILQETDDANALHRYELATPYGMSVDGYLRYFRKRQEES